MARGGYREKAGGISTWKHGKTKTIRVPILLVDQVLEIARALDNGQKLVPLSQQSKDTSDADTESKVLNLSGVKLRADRDGIVVRLEDLVRAGYKIYPERLAMSLEPVLRVSLGG